MARNKDIIYNRTRVPHYDDMGWLLPGCKFTTNQRFAAHIAEKIDRKTEKLFKSR